MAINIPLCLKIHDSCFLPLFLSAFFACTKQTHIFQKIGYVQKYLHHLAFAKNIARLDGFYKYLYYIIFIRFYPFLYTLPSLL